MASIHDSVWDILKRAGAVLRDDHFVYTKGGHGSEYVNKDAVFMHPDDLSALCLRIAAEYASDRVDVVLGPAVGGALVAQWVAFHLRALTGHPVLALYADKDGKDFVLKRGYDAFVPGKNILIVEDILNSGGSARQTAELALAHKGRIIGLGALCNRGGVRVVDLGCVPRAYYCVSVNMEVHDSAQCPLCTAGVPINTKIGKGAEFVAKYGQPQKRD